MGEAKRRANVAVREAVEALAVDTVGGRVQVRWNTHRAATPFGQLAFVVEFLNLTRSLEIAATLLNFWLVGRMCGWGFF